jgi:TPR repeat protein
MTARRLRVLVPAAIAVAVLLGAGSPAAQEPPPAPAKPIGPAVPPDPLQEGARAYSQGNFGGALRYWGPLAQRGNGAAQFNVGRMYARGEGVSRDLPEAYKWFTLAAMAGRPEGERARHAVSRDMSTAQMAEGMRRAEEWRQRRR